MKIVVQDLPRLHSPNPLDRFLEIPLQDPDGLQQARQNLKGRNYPRSELIHILQDYNESIGNDLSAMRNIHNLSDPEAVCIVTGQQLGFMGGPAYTILKALTCLLLAREAGAVPVFWLATEDHDVAEIDHTYLLDALGNLEKFYLPLSKSGESVEDLKLDSHHAHIIAQFLQAVQQKPIKIDTSYASTMASFLARLFAGTGLVFIEPRYLRKLAVPFFRREIIESDEIQRTLAKTTEALEEAGGRRALALPAEDTNLFMKLEGGRRNKVRRANGGFLVGGTTYSQAELLNILEKQPERFSPNVAARPVLQSLLFPTAAYVAGPSELKYYLQLGDYHKWHGTAMPWIVPRLSCTLIPPYAQMLLEKCRLNPWEHIPDHWTNFIPELGTGIQEMSDEWHQSAVRHFGKDLEEASLARYVRYYAGKIHRKVLKKRLRKRGIPPHALHLFKNLLHPHGKLQERVLNWCGFQAQTQENLIKAFLDQATWKTEGHLYYYL